MKQTAVEWLGNEITNRITRRNPHDTILIQTQGEILIELIEQAKAMEKEQIIESFSHGVINHHDAFKNENKFGNGEQYYNKTYKSE